MRSFWLNRLSLWSLFGCLSLIVCTQETVYAQAPAKPPAETEPLKAGTKKVVLIPIQNGGVDAGLLFQSVADELHWATGSVAGFSRAFGVEATGNRLTTGQLDTLVQKFPSVFSYQQSPSSSDSVLAVDTGALATMMADKKSNLRRWLASVDGEALSSLTQVASTWPSLPATASAPARIVVVTPGLHSPVKSAEDIALVLHQRTKLPMCVFRYPNDGPIAESSQWLIEELEALHAQYPTSRLTMVTHSMGGLVARGAIEIARLDSQHARASFATRVGLDRLIQICPPNHGSGLSDYGPLLEGFEQLYNLTQRRGDGPRQRVLVKMIADGFNEASADLNPKSDFLTELNQCNRDAFVQYTILAGDAGPLKPAMTNLLGGVWDRVSSAVNGPAGVDARLRDILNCAELQNGSGDGVVSVDSARLDGVSDFELLPMHHLTWADLNSEVGQSLVDAVTRRLGISL